MPPIRTRDGIDILDIQNASEHVPTSQLSGKAFEQYEHHERREDGEGNTEDERMTGISADIQSNKGRRSEILYDDDDMPPLVDAPASSDHRQNAPYVQFPVDEEEFDDSYLPPPTFRSMQHTFWTDMTPYQPDPQSLDSEWDMNSRRKGGRGKGKRRSRATSRGEPQFQRYEFPQIQTQASYTGTATIRASPPPPSSPTAYHTPPIFLTAPPHDLASSSGLYPDDSTRLPAIPTFPAFAPPEYEFGRNASFAPASRYENTLSSPQPERGLTASTPTSSPFSLSASPSPSPAGTPRDNLTITATSGPNRHADDIAVDDDDPEPEVRDTAKRVPRGNHSKKRPASYIPRAPNAFILFRAAFIRSERVPARVEGKNQTLSQIVGMLWKTLPASERAEWEAKAVVAQAEHRKKYPDWRFKPGTNASAKGDSFIGYDPGKKSKTSGKVKGRIKDGGTPSKEHNAIPGPGPSSIAGKQVNSTHSRWEDVVLDPEDSDVPNQSHPPLSRDFVAGRAGSGAQEHAHAAAVPFQFPKVRPPTSVTAKFIQSEDATNTSDRATAKKKKYATARVAQIAQLLVAGKEGEELEVAVDAWEATQKKKKDGGERTKREGGLEQDPAEGQAEDTSSQVVEASLPMNNDAQHAAIQPIIASHSVDTSSGSTQRYSYNLRSRPPASAPVLAPVAASINQAGSKAKVTDDRTGMRAVAPRRGRATKNKGKGRDVTMTECEDILVPRTDKDMETMVRESESLLGRSPTPIDAGTGLINALTDQISIHSRPCSPDVAHKDNLDMEVPTNDHESGERSVAFPSIQASALPLPRTLKRSLSAPPSDSRATYRPTTNASIGMEVDVTSNYLHDEMVYHDSSLSSQCPSLPDESVHGYSVPAPSHFEGGVASALDHPVPVSLTNPVLSVDDERGYAVPAPPSASTFTANSIHSQRPNSFAEPTRSHPPSAFGQSFASSHSRRGTVSFPVKPSEYARAVSISPVRSNYAARPTYVDGNRSHRATNDVFREQAAGAADHFSPHHTHVQSHYERSQSSSGVVRGRSFTNRHSRSSSHPHSSTLSRLSRDVDAHTFRGYSPLAFESEEEESHTFLSRADSPYPRSGLWNFNEDSDLGVSNETGTSGTFNRRGYDMYPYEMKPNDTRRSIHLGQNSPSTSPDSFSYHHYDEPFSHIHSPLASPSLPSSTPVTPIGADYHGSFPSSMSTTPHLEHYGTPASSPMSAFISPFSTLTGWAGGPGEPIPAPAQQSQWEAHSHFNSSIGSVNDDTQNWNFTGTDANPWKPPQSAEDLSQEFTASSSSTTNVLPNPHIISPNMMHDSYAAGILPNPRPLSAGLMHEHLAAFPGYQQYGGYVHGDHNLNISCADHDTDGDEPIVTSRISGSGLQLQEAVPDYNVHGPPRW